MRACAASESAGLSAAERRASVRIAAATPGDPFISAAFAYTSMTPSSSSDSASRLASASNSAAGAGASGPRPREYLSAESLAGPPSPFRFSESRKARRLPKSVEPMASCSPEFPRLSASAAAARDARDARRCGFSETRTPPEETPTAATKFSTLFCVPSTRREYRRYSPWDMPERNRASTRTASSVGTSISCSPEASTLTVRCPGSAARPARASAR